jgi:hypothetical protein
VLIVYFLRNLDSGAPISAHRQWIAGLEQAIVMVGECYYNYVTQIRFYSADRGWREGQRLFGTPLLPFLTAVSNTFIELLESSRMDQSTDAPQRM